MREIYALSPPLPTVPSHQGEVQTDTRTKDFFAYVKTEFDGKHDQVWDDVTSELVTSASASFRWECSAPSRWRRCAS